MKFHKEPTNGTVTTIKTCEGNDFVLPKYSTPVPGPEIFGNPI